MSTLSEFLASHTISGMKKEIEVSNRFVDKDGKKLLFTINVMGGDSFAEYQARCTQIDSKGRSNVNQKMLNECIVLNHTVDPSFIVVAEYTKLGYKTPEAYLYATLGAGEILTLTAAILKLSGFDKSVEELKEQVKN